MRKQKQVLSATVGLLLAIVSVSSAENFVQLVGAVAPEGDAYLIKHFSVPGGSVISGVRFYSNDLRTTFPSVSLLRGPTRTVSDAEVLAKLSQVRPTAQRHLVAVVCAPITIRSPQDLYVTIELPASDGIAELGTGAGIGAWALEGSPTSYFVSGVDGHFGAMDVDFGIDLVYDRVGKAHAPNAEPTPAPMPAVLQVQTRPSEAQSAADFALALPQPAHVAIDVYDVAGRRVVRVAEGKYAAGWHQVTWNGLDANGRRAASGLYLYKAQVNEEQRTGKVVVLR